MNIRRRAWSSRSVWATTCEVVGVIVFGVGLAHIASALAWVWAGVVCFVVSYLLEAGAPGGPDAAPLHMDRSGSDEWRTLGGADDAGEP